MFGRGFLRDPGLLYNEGKDSKDIFEKFWAFHDLVYEGYQERNMGDRNVLFKMKELWSYQVYQLSLIHICIREIKRNQALPFCHKQQNGKCCNRQSCIQPVSYTHLDVYKRQLFLLIFSAFQF